MMYASKISVNTAPQKVKYQRSVELPGGLMALEDISKHLKHGEKFSISEEQKGCFVSAVIMYIYGERAETRKETAERIAKASEYNKKYEEFHARNKR